MAIKTKYAERKTTIKYLNKASERRNLRSIGRIINQCQHPCNKVLALGFLAVQVASKQLNGKTSLHLMDMARKYSVDEYKQIRLLNGWTAMIKCICSNPELFQKLTQRNKMKNKELKNILDSSIDEIKCCFEHFERCDEAEIQNILLKLIGKVVINMHNPPKEHG